MDAQQGTDNQLWRVALGIAQGLTILGIAALMAMFFTMHDQLVRLESVQPEIAAMTSKLSNLDAAGRGRDKQLDNHEYRIQTLEGKQALDDAFREAHRGGVKP